jgi:hypothetical protein
MSSCPHSVHCTWLILARSYFISSTEHQTDVSAEHNTSILRVNEYPKETDYKLSFRPKPFLFVDPEEGGFKFLRNVYWLSDEK